MGRTLQQISRRRWGVLICALSLSACYRPLCPTDQDCVDVKIGFGNACGLDARGRPRCWGYTLVVQEGLEVPTRAALAQLDAADAVWCGVEVGGQAVCWGMEGSSGSPILSAPERPVTEVAVGSCVACGADEEGVVECWPLWEGCAVEEGPPPGRYHGLAVASPQGVCALDADSRLVCWGGPDPRDPLLALAPEGEVFAQLCASWKHFCALDADGFATCWGQHMGFGSLPDDVPFQHISCSESASCAVDLAGRAECWGYGIEETTERVLPDPDPNTRFVRVDVEVVMACGVTVEGDIRCWGDNSDAGTQVPEGFP